MEFMLGANYWGSKYGTNMWKYWDEESVRKDLQELSKYGVRYLRVFPNWREFQPIHKLYGWAGTEKEYRFADDVKADNEFYLDMEKVCYFRKFCEIAGENNIKLVVSLVTGWMSGRLFSPPAIECENHITSHKSLIWQIRYVRGMVRNLKDCPEIAMWDLGNECNNMGKAETNDDAYLWTATIRNAILSEDSSRKIMSGMHSLKLEGPWCIQDQGELCDILTPHPYPSPSVGGDIDPANTLKTSLVGTAQIELYSGIGGKPAMIQESGTFNDMVGDGEVAADFARISILSGWANGSKGFLWWCAHDQLHLTTPPNSWGMNENELGMLRGDYSPKKVAYAIKEAGEAIENMPFGELPERITDGVCVLPDALNRYEYVALSAYTLAKQAGLNISFSYYKQPLPDAKLYFVPSLEGWAPLSMDFLYELMEKAEQGATVYISTGSGFVARSEKYFGLGSKGMLETFANVNANFGDFTVPIKYTKKFLMYPITAEVLAKDEDGTVIFSRNKVGKGYVYFLNSPIEKDIARASGVYEKYDFYKIYEMVGKEILDAKRVKSRVRDIAVTEHPTHDKSSVIVAVNYSNKPLPCDIEFPETADVTLCYGDGKEIPPCNMNVFKVKF